ncbi:MAG: MBL fold metallo-hydrolase [Planctomycetota bacterium]
MLLRLLASAHGRSLAEGFAAQPLTSFIVEGDGAGPLAVDAGAIGLIDDVDEMLRVREIVLTHAHIDHVATLPMFVEALVARGRAPVLVHASPGAIEALRAHLFSGPLFPDFEALTEPDGRPLMRLVPFPLEHPFDLAGFALTAFEVNHPVPTHGLLVDDGETAIVLGADSGPTERLWEIARSSPRVRAVVLEASFPDALQVIADGSGHLTPDTLRAELAKAPSNVRVLITHMKPAYRAEIRAAIAAIGDDRVELLEPGTEVQFS